MRLKRPKVQKPKVQRSKGQTHESQNPKSQRAKGHGQNPKCQTPKIQRLESVVDVARVEAECGGHAEPSPDAYGVWREAFGLWEFGPLSFGPLAFGISVPLVRSRPPPWPLFLAPCHFLPAPRSLPPAPFPTPAPAKKRPAIRRGR